MHGNRTCHVPTHTHILYILQSNKCLESGVWSLTSGEAYQTLKLDGRVGEKLGSSEREAEAAQEFFFPQEMQSGNESTYCNYQ